MSSSPTSSLGDDKVGFAWEAATWHYNQKNYVQAEAMTRQALSFQPSRPDIRCQLLQLLGDSIAAQGYHGHAYHAYFNAGQIAPDSRTCEVITDKISKLNASDPCFQVFKAHHLGLYNMAKLKAMTALQAFSLDDEQKAFLVCA